MIIGLEQLGEGFGGSLERTLFDRLLDNLMKLTATSMDNGSTAYLIFNQPKKKFTFFGRKTFMITF